MASRFFYAFNYSTMKHAKLEAILSKWVEDYNKYHKVKLTKNTFKDGNKRIRFTEV